MIPWSPAERISAPSSALDLADPSPQRITEEIERRRIHVDISSIMQDSAGAANFFPMIPGRSGCHPMTQRR